MEEDSEFGQEEKKLS